MSSYAHWVRRLDRFRAGDDSALDELGAMTVEWQPGVAERLSAQVNNALATRLEELRRRLQRDLDSSRDVSQVGLALVSARSGLAPISHLASLDAWPEPLREHLIAEVRRVVAELQEALERSVRPDSRAAIDMLAVLRRSRLTDALAGPARMGVAAHLPPAGRQIIV